MTAPPAHLRIRPRGDGEQPAVRAVVRRAWYMAYAAIYTQGEMDAVFCGRIAQVAEWSERRSRPAGDLVAEADGVIVGAASLALLRDGDGELVALYVLPEMQRLGIGGALWEAAADELRGRGCRRMWVWALERNPAALAFYRRRGCVDTEQAPFLLGTHSEPSLGMTLNLHAPE